MNKVNYNNFIDLIKTYNYDNVVIIEKAYKYAYKLHEGQKRESGEEYISHPLNVAYILAEMHADTDTICAALLHDVLEDTNTKKEDIAHEFNPIIADLVDGVTKISKLNFSSKEEQVLANTRKIITSITKDVRIIIIKLADRLHNMRTLEYKKEYKQKENSIETMEIFVPLAYYIGAYRIKSELEDISLKYLKPDIYKKISLQKEKIELDSKNCLNEMFYKISNILNDKNIPNEIKIRTKNVYGIYKRINEGSKLSDIHDLLSLKIMVDDIDNCYRTLGYIHHEYPPVNSRFKDYICNPKTNMYQSLHSTVFTQDEHLVQVQIRTFDMDKIASFGLTEYWNINTDNARFKMQEDLKNKYQFFTSLSDINTMFYDNKEFISQVKKEILSDKIYVYTRKGEIIELPIGSTTIDFAYKLNSEIGNTMVAAIVNDEYVPPETILKNKDRVKIITDDLSYGKRLNWEEKAHTSYAKRKIRELNKK